MTTSQSYRWNTSQAAQAFDEAAQHIHPYYLAIQDEILGQLRFETSAAFLLVDLGGGSGRLVERVLQLFPAAHAVLVDQSEPFLAIAERRLAPFAQRVTFIELRLQDDWPAALPDAPRAIVSMSAIHHLDSAEKQSLYARCFQCLERGSVFMNGDEFRPESDADYLAALERWSAHKDLASEKGLIPKSFDPMFEKWHDRNIRRFGQPKQSGDDCHETIATQSDYLRRAGFHQVETPWAKELWAVLIAAKQ